jgi:hypothetical protein
MTYDEIILLEGGEYLEVAVGPDGAVPVDWSLPVARGRVISLVYGPGVPRHVVEVVLTANNDVGIRHITDFQRLRRMGSHEDSSVGS